MLLPCEVWLFARWLIVVQTFPEPASPATGIPDCCTCCRVITGAPLTQYVMYSAWRGGLVTKQHAEASSCPRTYM